MRENFAALDIETTGLDPENDAIIEVGIVRFRLEYPGPGGNGHLQEDASWSSLVNPDRRIPYNIQQLTGISPRDVEQSPTIGEVAGRAVELLRGVILVGHNVAFDIAFLQRALGNRFPSAAPHLDTFELASILLPHMPRYSLRVLARELGFESSIQHRALADARTSMRLLFELYRRALEVPSQVIGEIVRLSEGSGWAAQAFFRQVERMQARQALSGSVAQRFFGRDSALEGELAGLVLSREALKEPVRPRGGEPRPLDVARLKGMLEDGGALAQELPGYEYRPQQVEMMERVAEGFNQGQHLLVEAGTGTGKSLAYLLPAAEYARTNSEHVVISTNTINLQDQLHRKDLPDLERILEGDFSYALLKGRDNYLCRRRLDLFLQRSGLRPVELKALAKILVWLQTTTTGDRAELNLVGEERMWARVSAHGETCLGERCPYQRRDGCFLYRARRQAESAHLIVVNHSLLVAAVVAGNRVLPEYHHLIIDEAHHLEEAATRQLSFQVDQYGVASLLNELSSLGTRGRETGLLALIAELKLPAEAEETLGTLRDDIARARQNIGAFFTRLNGFLEAQGRGNRPYDRVLRVTGATRAQPGWSQVEIEWDNLALSVGQAERGLERLRLHLETEEEEELTRELINCSSSLREMREQMNAIICQPSARGIYWCEAWRGGERLSLHAAPLEVGPLLEEEIFRHKNTVILTSATLQVGESFDYLRERLGLWEAEELALDSPFDYANSTLLYVPTDIPEPNWPHFQEAVQEGLVELCRAAQGRTLALFTSHNQLRRTYQSIAPRLAQEGIQVLAQTGGSSRHQLLESFKSGERMVLLGTRSFWEGVDVVGEALSCLAIARLPFPVPTEPIFEARSEGFDDPFNEYAVPRTVLTFRQGFGRLIRSRQDRGVVVIFDKRVLTKYYGQVFLQSLPRCTFKRGPIRALADEVMAWLGKERPYQPQLNL